MLISWKIFLRGISEVWRERNKKANKPKQTLSCYFAGPMEACSDNGLEWRLRYRNLLSPLGIHCVIPNFEEAELISDPSEMEHYKFYNLRKYIDTMRAFIKKDLQFVLETDFTVVRWEGERMAGTVGEVQHAYLNNKPVYLVTSQPTYKIPGWFLACFTERFNDINELIGYLKRKHSL